MLQEGHFICITADCTERQITQWNQIMNHTQQGHEVLEKNDLLGQVNTMLIKKKSHVLQDLLARVNKIMINQEEQLKGLIERKFADAYSFWKEELQQLQQLQDYIFPNEITADTSLLKIFDIYQSLDNDQLHVFSEFINQVEQTYIILIKQMNQILDKAELEIKVVQQQLSTQIQKNKALRELKNSNDLILKEQLIEAQKAQKIDDTLDLEKKSINLSNEYIQPQKLSVYSNERENNICSSNGSNDKLRQNINYNYRENFYSQSSNQRNSNHQIGNQQSESPEDNHISFHEIIDKQKTFRTNKVTEYQEYKQPLRGYRESYQPYNYNNNNNNHNNNRNNNYNNYNNNMYQQQQEPVYQPRENSIDKYYKKRTQSQNYNQQYYQQQQQQEQPYSIIIYEKGTSNSPPKPPPLRGYKERQQEDTNTKLKMMRSADKRKYIDQELLSNLKNSTPKRFDIDKSEKHMKYSNKFSSIQSPKESFAIVEGVFRLSEHHQFSIAFRAQDQNYDIEAGMVNYSQIKQRNEFPNFYGINRNGECISTKQQTPIELNSEQTYLFAYRHEEKLLICVDLAKNLQHPIELPDDEKSEFAFFVRMRNLLVQLI